MENKKPIINNLISIACGVALAVAALQVIQPTIVNGDSMYPNLKNGNYLIVNKLAYKNAEPEYGDIVVFPRTDELLIKRIEGKPGDVMTFKDGKLYRNGKEVKETYIDYPTYNEKKVVVGANQYFVLGDNRTNSLDSRFKEVGCIDKSEIIGRAEIRLFPSPKKLGGSNA